MLRASEGVRGMNPRTTVSGRKALYLLPLTLALSLGERGLTF